MCVCVCVCVSDKLELKEMQRIVNTGGLKVKLLLVFFIYFSPNTLKNVSCYYFQGAQILSYSVSTMLHQTGKENSEQGASVFTTLGITLHPSRSLMYCTDISLCIFLPHVYAFKNPFVLMQQIFSFERQSHCDSAFLPLSQ